MCAARVGELMLASRGRAAAASIDGALGVIRLLPCILGWDGIDMKALSCVSRMGRMGVGLVDLLRAVTWRGSGRSLCLGLGSKASIILFAAFIVLDRVGVREAAEDDGGTGMTGSDGSGKVLERLLGKDRGGVFIANALGGEVGVRATGFGLRAYGPEILSGSGLVCAEGSNVGDGTDRFGASSVGD